EPLSHGVPAIGYRLGEPDGRRMLPDRPPPPRGPAPPPGAGGRPGASRRGVGRRQRRGGLAVGDQVVGCEQVSEPRRGQRFAFIMDTRLCDAAFALADGADMLVCESTFADADAALA